MEDFEPEVSAQITNNSIDIAKLAQSFKEMQKEIFDYKRYIELSQTTRDLKFEQEVRNCLNEQLTYINELQTEMFKEVEQIRKQNRDVSWQIGKLETEFEAISRASPQRKNSPHKKNETSTHQKQPKIASKISQMEAIEKKASDGLKAAELVADFIKIQNLMNVELSGEPIISLRNSDINIHEN